jgi:hypothetical protein
MAQYEIESGVPLPPVTRARAGGHRSIYPFVDMLPGQSFTVEFNGEDSKRVTRRVRTAILVFKRSHRDYKFHTRQDDSSIRVWRM